MTEGAADDIQEQLDMLVVRDMIREARQTVPRGDERISAFLSEVAATDLARYFRWLEPGE